jgi:hypothetical protein
MATLRDHLIRKVFELRRDVTWWQKVEPQLKDLGMDSASIQGYRQAWNQDMEQKDWAQWQREAARFSNAVLDDMRVDCIERLDSLGTLQWLREKAHRERDQLQQVFTGTLDREKRSQERSMNDGRER